MVDGTLLAAYCAMSQRWVEASEALDREGCTTVTAEGRRLVSPYFQIARDALNLMHKLAGEFGLTPAARVRVVKGAPPVDDLLEAFLQTGKKARR